MLTEKVLFCIVMVPSLWMIYGLLMYFFTSWESTTIALAMLSLPFFSYTGITVAEEGMIEFNDLRPTLMRILPSTRQRLAALPSVRKELQDDLRAFIRSNGPALGEVYYGTDMDWTTIKEQSKSDPDDSKKTK